MSTQGSQSIDLNPPSPASQPAPYQPPPPPPLPPAAASRRTVPVCAEVVRSRLERSRMNAEMCPQCRGFFLAAGMDPTEAAYRSCLQDCGRHRSRTPEQPGTPSSFWDIGFNSTQGSAGGGAASPGARSTRSLLDDVFHDR